ncbi:MAG TPA: hypothetical protein PKE21_16175 [Flavobacteriales bacterium]|mgnify:CR=1 FL=1|nr:hypothetical protein [Flavobacteriales bacterium]HMR29016.1 hypothetical protein [Flavobacteriales bacterium]
MAVPGRPEIRFETKEESNARREREFMALTPWERLVLFLRDIERNPPAEHERGEAKGNFIIRKRSQADQG